jgi:hypothetical protein
MANYSSTSPYFTTGYSQFYLDTMTNRPIAREQDDALIEISQTYQYRPDLLAYDVYGQAGLWWVFYQRNPNTLFAPPWDFEAGLEIYLPKIATLQQALGF